MQVSYLEFGFNSQKKNEIELKSELKYSRSHSDEIPYFKLFFYDYTKNTKSAQNLVLKRCVLECVDNLMHHIINCILCCSI